MAITYANLFYIVVTVRQRYDCELQLPMQYVTLVPINGLGVIID